MMVTRRRGESSSSVTMKGSTTSSIASCSIISLGLIYLMSLFLLCDSFTSTLTSTATTTMLSNSNARSNFSTTLASSTSTAFTSTSTSTSIPITGDTNGDTNSATNSATNSGTGSGTSININTKNENINHDNFDYLSHWYPVSWAQDLQIDKPAKVTLFDVDYVIAKINNSNSNRNSNKKNKNKSKNVQEEVICMIDICPHKSAALSEGRITKPECGTKSPSFQCAYHGWTFDSKNGECIDIPQVDTSTGIADTSTSTSTARSNRRNGKDIKSNGQAIPAMIVHGMVWIFPGRNDGRALEDALLAPPPPSIPELELDDGDSDEFQLITPVVRDFPIDWTILLENIMDPDHGLFAHQNTAFDLYTASKTNPISIQETSTNNGKGWSITSQVDATYELLKRNEIEEQMLGTNTKKKPKYSNTNSDSDSNSGTSDKNKNKKDNKSEILKSTTTFIAPNLITLGRRDEQYKTKQMTVFFICPTGTGKSRFMSCQIVNTKTIPKFLKIPRWLVHVFLNNFLDQDTYLLATQQRHVLATESQLLLDMEMEMNMNMNMNSQYTDGDDDDNKDMTKKIIPVRKKLYNYRSPTEKLGIKVGNWLDTTLSRVPNRLPSIRAYGGYNKGLETLNMSREKVLDRYTQNTSICKDSMDVVKNCRKVRKSMKLLAFFPFFIRLMMFGVVNGGGSVSASTSAGTALFASKSGGMISSLFHSSLTKVNQYFSPNLILLTWVISAMITKLAMKLEREFKFKYTEEYREKDMDKIPTIWSDRL